MVLKNRVHRLSDDVNVLLQALYETWPTPHATYDDVIGDLIRSKLARDRGRKRDVILWLSSRGYADLLKREFGDLGRE